jgi:uncharacterized protein YeaO (DUF488 family)
MPLRVVRLGSPRHSDEGLRLGTVRRPPRGVRKENYAREDHFDVWLPDLAPSAALLSWIKSRSMSPKVWSAFSKRYFREMSTPEARRLLALIAALSKQTNVSVGCYCEDEERCHRSLLRRLLEDEGAVFADAD